MNLARPIALSIVCACLASLGTAAWSADSDDHTAHHPAATASAARVAPVPKAATPSKTAPAKAAAKEVASKMDQQMKAMGEMHEKMMNAKTPDERQALMAEHMKTMQGGMGMMGGMGGAGKEGISGGASSEMASRQQMMEKRMNMMESMMQMMMDRMPLPAAK